LRGEANAQALAWLECPQNWPGGRLAIHGDAGTGKTHLIHLFMAQHGAALLAGHAMRGLPPSPQTPLAIDDADLVAEPESLLHALNAAAEAGFPVLLAARTPPSRWPATLPDLDSRLRAIHAVGLGQPDEALLNALLARLIAERQMRVEEGVQKYLLARLPRNCAAIREAAARLDRASLSAGTRVTQKLAGVIAAELQDDPAMAPGDHDDFEQPARKLSPVAVPLL